MLSYLLNVPERGLQTENVDTTDSIQASQIKNVKELLVKSSPL